MTSETPSWFQGGSEVLHDTFGTVRECLRMSIEHNCAGDKSRAGVQRFALT
jgi:hypothetical protein